MKNGKLTETKINTHLQEVSEEKRLIQMRMKELQEELNKKEEVEKELKKKKEYISNKEPRVSDHALLRYFERIEGYNMEEIKKKILSPRVIDQMNILGSKGVYAADDFYVLVKNKTVVTVYKGE